MTREEFTARRKALGLTQNEVARRIGMTKGAFSQVVNGKRPGRATWVKVRQLFRRLGRRRGDSA